MATNRTVTILGQTILDQNNTISNQPKLESGRENSVPNGERLSQVSATQTHFYPGGTPLGVNLTRVVAPPINADKQTVDECNVHCLLVCCQEICAELCAGPAAFAVSGLETLKGILTSCCNTAREACMAYACIGADEDGNCIRDPYFYVYYFMKEDECASPCNSEGCGDIKNECTTPGNGGTTPLCSCDGGCASGCCV